MKKSNFVASILGTAGVVFFALGMCMCMLPQWGMFRQGIVAGTAGLAVLLATVFVWRRMEGKAPVRVTGKTVGKILLGLAGAILFGAGMCMSMVFGKMAVGIAIGLAGLMLLLLLIPLTRGVHD